jgi:hypothetical protein
VNLTEKIIKLYNGNMPKSVLKLYEQLQTDSRDDRIKLLDRLQGIIIDAILVGTLFDIDLIESLDHKYRRQSFKVFIPVMPPGINETYGVNCKSKRKVYKTPVAKQWQVDAIMPIRTAANIAEFFIDKDDKLSIYITIFGSKYDVDAPIKLIIDTIADTLDFNDKIVSNVESRIIRQTERDGVMIDVEKV